MSATEPQAEPLELTRPRLLAEIRRMLAEAPDDYAFVFVAVSQSDPDAMSFAVCDAASRAVPVSALRRAAMLIDSEWAAERDFNINRSN